ncbi:YhcN/YlaJ family sporulation lipoprotein [Bacillus tianshenii]|uniref:YhcN/YlaJ family sporulation lipoprotein n=1 Tax=Sutcliffiella tianshenii TaxID=1463404 RepID=UPI001CD79520|nr:YhcN/YlaJ family sporulation lipoprotein [Bacillus tianshenii]MCA1320050.1 YhcN/YlaJ family sporulation lipoprotein [Bacillus tianshenii]
MKILKLIIPLFFALSWMSGCGGGEVKERVTDSVTQTSTKQKEKTNKEQRAEEIAKSLKEVKGAIAYDSEDQLLVAFHVIQSQKFFTEQIEKKVKKALEKEFPDEKVIVSHDLKIRLEIERLRRDIERDNMDEKEIKKRLEQIEDLRNEKA